MGTTTAVTQAEAFALDLNEARRVAQDIMATGVTLVPDVCDAEMLDLIMNYADGDMHRYHDAHQAGEHPAWSRYDFAEETERTREHVAVLKGILTELRGED